VSGSGYPSALQATLSLQVINTTTGAVLETIPLPQNAYSANGSLSWRLPVTIPNGVTQVGVQLVSGHSRWQSKRITLQARHSH
jgi:hypothetical protein